ncbi:hypothetical protein EC973_006948 [Apophysomyces ossiformis]|uniref:Uncharacterized protein n=1 Tax=Apophysomyces ossiformis TaxID=679940 RepID=A0A8H7BSI4_9FUNG|nr:hypothetical protein EC973_006948 [Apophysomyces ossiformis]
MTQGVYVSPKSPLKPSSSIPGTLIGSEYGSPFERDLVDYLDAYENYEIVKLRERLMQYDWSSCKAVIIGSVPGYHRESAVSKWGLGRLSKVLRTHVSLPPECCQESTIIAQCSSVANFSEKWFYGDFASSMSAASNEVRAARPHLRFIYPTVRDVSQRYLTYY